ncbi:MAG: SRPBCC family protein [Chloroflexi bacterium]|nr:SRPBCC family protein [Chloroflexota bacterium]
MRMTILRNAPVVVDKEIEIFSPPEVIWHWIRRVDLWVDWHPEVSSAWFIDDEAVGARFKWRKKMLGVRCEIVDSASARRWAWKGRSWGVKARQEFRLDGNFRSTVLSSTMTLEGPTSHVLKPIVRKVATHWTEVWLGVLKTRIESQHERGRANHGGGGGTTPLAERVRRSVESERARLGL